MATTGDFRGDVGNLELQVTLEGFCLWELWTFSEGSDVTEVVECVKASKEKLGCSDTCQHFGEDQLLSTTQMKE